MSEINYRKRMQKKKEYIDDKIAQANIDKGVIVLLTGNGKGKSSSALGMVCRCLGYGKKVAIAKFLKGEIDSGEDLFLSQHDNVELIGVKTTFTWETQDKQKDIEIANQTWQQIKPFLKDPKIHLVVLDEITYMISYKYLDEDDVVNTIINRPENQNVVLTGRAAKNCLIEISDTVSEVKNIKHAFMKNIKAQEGIDI